MIEASKISIAMELIQNEIGKCMNKMRESKDEKSEQKYKELIAIRNEIYKGNYEIINKVIGDAEND